MARLAVLLVAVYLSISSYEIVYVLSKSASFTIERYDDRYTAPRRVRQWYIMRVYAF